MAESVRSRHQKRLEALKQERAHYHGLWQEADKYVTPGRLRLSGNAPGGDRKMSAIVDETGYLAHRTLMSGMHSGLTSPARPWFKVAPEDPALREFGPVKTYLFQCEKIMRNVLRQSNIYNCLHAGYGDAAQFGQFAMIVVGDARNLRAIPILNGQFWIGTDPWGQVDTLYRNIRMTVKQVVQRFVFRGEKEDWSRVSNAVKNLWDRGNYDAWVEIYHAIEPRLGRDRSKKDRQNKPWASNYWEDGRDNDQMLDESGFDFNRILAPRWSAAGEHVYSSMHPGEAALPAIKMLQSEQIAKGKGITKKVDPPLQGPTELRTQRISTMPGGITYHDDPTGRAGLRPVYDVNLSIAELMGDIQEVQQRINQIFFADLFRAIEHMGGVQPRNNLEMRMRQEEQLLQLGPVIENMNNDLINPLVEIVYHTCEEMELFPEHPRELENAGPLQVENISMLAQAQRAVSTGAIERAVAFAGQIAAIKPDILDKADLDQAFDEYADAIGAPVSIIRSDDAVEKIRAERQQQMEQQTQMQAASQLAPVVKDGADALRIVADARNNPGGEDLLRSIGLA